MSLILSRDQVRGKDSEENPPKDPQQAVSPREQEEEERIHWRPGEQVVTVVLEQMKQKRKLCASNHGVKIIIWVEMKLAATEHNPPTPPPPDKIPSGSSLRVDLIADCFLLHGSYGKFVLIGWRHVVHTTRSCRGKSSIWKNATCEGIIYLVIFILHTGSWIWTFYPALSISAPWWNNYVSCRRWSWMDPTNRPRLGPAFWWELKEEILAHERSSHGRSQNMFLVLFWIIYLNMLFQRNRCNFLSAPPTPPPIMISILKSNTSHIFI